MTTGGKGYRRISDNRFITCVTTLRNKTVHEIINNADPFYCSLFADKKILKNEQARGRHDLYLLFPTRTYVARFTSSSTKGVKQNFRQKVRIGIALKLELQIVDVENNNFDVSKLLVDKSLIPS